MREMKRDNPLKHFVIAFLIAIAIYVIAYGWIELRRHRKGAWEVTFSVGFQNAPVLIINQPKLGITNFEILFYGEKVPSSNGVPAEKIVFDQPKPVPFDVPFGKCIFTDLTFLPGTVTFSNVFGHEIELMPRVLIINYKEHSWAERRIALSHSP